MFEHAEVVRNTTSECAMLIKCDAHQMGFAFVSVFVYKPRERSVFYSDDIFLVFWMIF